MPRIKQIQTRRDTSVNWMNVNPILALGEAGLETDSNLLKYGDGVTLWNNLPYFAPYQDSIVGISGTKSEYNTSLTDGNFLFDGDAVEEVTSTGNTITITPSGDDINIEVVQATESQLGGGQITTQAIIEDETTTNDLKLVTPKKFWQGWVKGLTLTSFFNAVRGTVLTGFSSAVTWARVTTALANNKFSAHKVWKFSSSTVKFPRSQFAVQ